MRKLVYQVIYKRNLIDIVVLMVLLTIFWTILGTQANFNKSGKQQWKVINLLFSVLGIMAILLITVILREGAGREIILHPLHSFIEAKTQPEMYRSMFMNVFLFFPLGLTLPYALSEKWKHQIRWTILAACILSCAIEYLQYHFSLGRTEIDDVICNTLGTAIGTISYFIAKRGNESNK